MANPLPDSSSTMQQQVYINWINSKLQSSPVKSPLPPDRRRLSSLTLQLADGILLCELVNTLLAEHGRQGSAIRITYNTFTKVKKLENIQACIDVVKKSGINVINIAAEDIFSGETNTTLYLIWSLIVHFQIGSKKLSPRKHFLSWIRTILPQHKITNLTSDWSTGVLLSSIINAIKPGSCPAPDNTTDYSTSCKIALNTANRLYNIPLIMTAVSLSSTLIDEQCMMLYLSYYCTPINNALILPWVRRVLPANRMKQLADTDWLDGTLLLSIAEARLRDVINISDLVQDAGLLYSVVKLIATTYKLDIPFTVRELQSQQIDRIAFQTFILQLISIANTIPIPTPITTPITTTANNISSSSNNTANISKTIITTPITTTIATTTTSIPISTTTHTPTSIITRVTSTATAASRINIIDRNLIPTTVKVGETFRLQIDATGADTGLLTAELFYNGCYTEQPVLIQHKNDIYHISTILHVTGEYSLHIYWNSSQIPYSPLPISAIQTHCTIDRTALQNSIAVNELAYFSISNYGETCDDVTVSIRHMADSTVSIPYTMDVLQGYANVCFTPKMAGEYAISVLSGSVELAGTPFRISVTDASKCCIIGETAASLSPRYMQLYCAWEAHIDTYNAGSGNLTILTDGGTGLECAVTDNNNNNSNNTSLMISIKPVQLGSYQCSLLWQGVHIPHSPFVLTVLDLEGITVLGSPVEAGCCNIGEPVECTVYYESCAADLTSIAPTLSVRGATTHCDIQLTKQSAGMSSYAFTPWECGEHVMEVWFGDLLLDECPFLFDVITPGNMSASASGDGLQHAVTGIPARFTILAEETGLYRDGKLEVRIYSTQEVAKYYIKDNDDCTYSVVYIAKRKGAFLIDAYIDGAPISGSSFKVSVTDKPIASCIVSGAALKPSAKLTLGRPLDFTVDTTKAGNGTLNVRVLSLADSSVDTPVTMHQYRDGYYQVNITPSRVGAYSIAVLWNNGDVTGSPYEVYVQPSDTDHSRCIAYGAGLTTAKIGESSKFYVSTADAGIGSLEVTVHDANNSNNVFTVHVDHAPDNVKLLVCRYKPRYTGYYSINLKWVGHHISGSPFGVEVQGTSCNESMNSLPDSLDTSEYRSEYRQIKQLYVSDSDKNYDDDYDDDNILSRHADNEISDYLQQTSHLLNTTTPTPSPVIPITPITTTTPTTTPTTTTTTNNNNNNKDKDKVKKTGWSVVKQRKQEIISLLDKQNKQDPPKQAKNRNITQTVANNRTITNTAANNRTITNTVANNRTITNTAANNRTITNTVANNRTITNTAGNRRIDKRKEETRSPYRDSMSYEEYYTLYKLSMPDDTLVNDTYTPVTTTTPTTAATYTYTPIPTTNVTTTTPIPTTTTTTPIPTTTTTTTPNLTTTTAVFGTGVSVTKGKVLAQISQIEKQAGDSILHRKRPTTSSSWSRPTSAVIATAASSNGSTIATTTGRVLAPPPDGRILSPIIENANSTNLYRDVATRTRTMEPNINHTTYTAGGTTTGTGGTTTGTGSTTTGTGSTRVKDASGEYLRQEESLLNAAEQLFGVHLSPIPARKSENRDNADDDADKSKGKLFNKKKDSRSKDKIEKQKKRKQKEKSAVKHKTTSPKQKSTSITTPNTTIPTTTPTKQSIDTAEDERKVNFPDNIATTHTFVQEKQRPSIRTLFDRKDSSSSRQIEVKRTIPASIHKQITAQQKLQQQQLLYQQQQPAQVYMSQPYYPMYPVPYYTVPAIRPNNMSIAAYEYMSNNTNNNATNSLPQHYLNNLANPQQSSFYY